MISTLRGLTYRHRGKMAKFDNLIKNSKTVLVSLELLLEIVEIIYIICFCGQDRVDKRRAEEDID